MSDRAKSTPPPFPTDANTWQELAPWRETFLRYCCLRPELQTILRAWGELLFASLLELQPSLADGRGKPDEELSEVSAELRAIAADLTYLSGRLQMVARYATESDLTTEDRVRAELAGEVSAEVEALAEHLTEAVAP